VVAVDQSGRPKPFQELMHRFRRTSDVRETIERIPVRLYLFDLLYLDGRSVIDLPQDDRRKLLEEVCPPELLAPDR
jgi:DNA ligase-1